MIEEFIKKYNNLEYISNKFYKTIINNNSNLFPKNFNLDEYNMQVLNKLYVEQKEYFDNMFNDIDKNIHLDEEQIKAILSDEDYTLILAGAGTGKTTTIAAKVKYLVEKKNVNPNKILVISYTKKATEELEKRIVIDFGIKVNVSTFHSLGYKIVKNIYSNKKPYIVDFNIQDNIFLDYFKNIFKDKEKIKLLTELFTPKEIGENFVFSKHFLNNYMCFNTWEEYFEDYKKNKLEEAYNSNKGLRGVINNLIENKVNADQPVTINGEFVKSKGEAIIANFLYSNGIEYYYEKVYDEVMPDGNIYRPDFTLNLGGEPVYIEYFGLSNYKDNELNTYNKNKKIKEDYHRDKKNKFISVDYHRGEDLEKELEYRLIEMGFNLKLKTDEEIYDRILSTNELSTLYPLKNFYYSVIETIKSSLNRNQVREVVDNYLETLVDKESAKNQYDIIYNFYCYYQNCLYGGEVYGFDYSDLIYWAKENIVLLNSEIVNYEYVIIDEYQDISFDRYELTHGLINRNGSKIIAVGDDWQTIFSFAGSKIEYIYNFQKYYEYSKTFTISKTYRNSQKLVDYAGKFIMKNESQLVKKLESDKSINNPIIMTLYDEEKETEVEVLKKLINKIHTEKPNDNILILSRYNKTIGEIFKDHDFKDDINTKIKIKNIDNIEIDAMSIHKSKGLTADEVIVMGLNNSFPTEDRNDFWLKELFKNNVSYEKIEYAEERRVFYVALTRTKNHVFLLIPSNVNHRSKFINEIDSIINMHN